jgi:hypothetical protein
MLKLEFNSIEEMQEFFFTDDRDYELIYDNTYKCIEKAIDNKEKIAILVVIKFKNKINEVIMESKFEDFPKILNTCLNYFENTEDYKKCNEIKNIIYKLNTIEER